MAQRYPSEEMKDLKNDVQWNSLKSLQLNIHTFFPKCFHCWCLKPSKEQRIRSKSYAHILQETSISHIIQQLRVLNAVCKKSLSKDEWERQRQKHSLIAYSDLESENA